MANKAIKMRGHHLFCGTISDHEGTPVYNAEFCANMRRYQNMMRSNPGQKIEIVLRCGDTCLYCPSRVEKDNKCQLYDYEPGSNGIDLRVLDRLGYKVGEEITSGELRERVKAAYGKELPDMCFNECGLSPVLKCAEGLRNL